MLVLLLDPLEWAQFLNSLVHHHFQRKIYQDLNYYLQVTHVLKLQSLLARLKLLPKLPQLLLGFG